MRKAPEYGRKPGLLFAWFWRPLAAIAGAIIGVMAGVIGAWAVAAIADGCERAWREAVEEERASASVGGP